MAKENYDIQQIDKNFYINPNCIDKEDVVFYNAEKAPFQIFGVFREGDGFKRMPEEVAKTVNPGVATLFREASGGRISFRTNSKYIAISVEYGIISQMPHFALTGSVGFDIYGDNIPIGTFVPRFEMDSPYQFVCNLGNGEERDYVIYMPTYSEVKSIHIGLQESSVVKPYNPYKDIKPIVYYGSSITQGGCCSRPGMTYQSIISRKLPIDYVNLGFSGNAKGEDTMVNYINGLEMSAFVMDYDHNAPTNEHLISTHQKMYETIRATHKDLPIIMMNRPCFLPPNSPYYERKQIVENTYKNAIKKGDKNVYFISGEELTELCGREGAVDLTHPTDFGFNSMAQAIYKVLKNIFN